MIYRVILVNNEYKELNNVIVPKIVFFFLMDIKNMKLEERRIQ